MEAHPADSALSFGESVSGEWHIKKPKSVEERIQNAKSWHTKSKAKAQLLVDNFEDECNLTFAAWTERFYILQGGKVVYQGEDMFTYSVNETRHALKKILDASQGPAGASVSAA